MTDTNKLTPSPQKKLNDIIEKEAGQPRTYRVTRSQMKEIWEKTVGSAAVRIASIVRNSFDLFENEATLTEETVKEIVAEWDSYPPLPDTLKSIFPEYFHIPEGEPVLCKRYEADEWRIRVSDGKGGAYDNGLLSGEVKYFKQMIPFTKNPPK